jgi:dTDP-4-dehydrorhamnose reductase
VLVLGAQGVLGSVLAAAFRDGGWEVVRAGHRPEAGVSLVDRDKLSRELTLDPSRDYQPLSLL